MSMITRIFSCKSICSISELFKILLQVTDKLWHFSVFIINDYLPLVQDHNTSVLVFGGELSWVIRGLSFLLPYISTIFCRTPGSFISRLQRWGAWCKNTHVALPLQAPSGTNHSQILLARVSSHPRLPPSKTQKGGNCSLPGWKAVLWQ